jgi:hypothetical protein
MQTVDEIEQHLLVDLRVPAEIVARHIQQLKKLRQRRGRIKRRRLVEIKGRWGPRWKIVES